MSCACTHEALPNAVPAARIHAPQQRSTAFPAQVAAAEVNLNDSMVQPSELRLLIHTLWVRYSLVVIGGQIPVTPLFGTWLPISA